MISETVTPPSEPTIADDVLVGRQPIYDRDLQVVAYELLFRGGAGPGSIDGSQATSQVAVHAFLDIGLEAIVGRKDVFLNMTRELLLGGERQAFPAKQTVLEILEDIEPDEKVIVAVGKAAAQGYRVALDDFVYRPELAGLVDIAHVIKVELPKLDADGLRRHAELLRRPGVMLLAEKVETREELRLCRDLGFDLFQGYFLKRPDIVKGRRSPGNRMAVMQLLAEINRPDASVLQLEKLILRDASLGFKLIRLSNAAGSGFGRPITSIRQAVQQLGLDAVAAWANVLLLAQIKDKPSDLLTTALVRSKMCEQLGRELGSANPESFALAGLFSMLDALMDAPMEELLGSLPLGADIKGGLLNREGRIGETLRCVVANECGDWEKVSLGDLKLRTIRESYIAAVAQATRTAKGFA